MRKITYLFIVVTMLLSFISCKKDKNEPQKNNTITFGGKTSIICKAELIEFTGSQAQPDEFKMFSIRLTVRNGNETATVLMTLHDDNSNILSGKYPAIGLDNQTATRGIIPFASIVQSGIELNDVAGTYYYTGEGGSVNVKVLGTQYEINLDNISVGNYADIWDNNPHDDNYGYSEVDKISGYYKGGLIKETQDISANPKTLNVLVIEQDPYLKTKDNMRASIYLKQNKDQVVTDLVEDIEYSSHGNIAVNIVKKEHFDEFATFTFPILLKNGQNSNQLDEETWLEIMKNGWWGFWDNPFVKNIRPHSYDYDYLLNKLDLINRRSGGEFDEVWLVNVDPENNFESILVGSSAYWINGSPIIKNTTNFKIMNVSISRPDANFECFGHAAELILRNVFNPRFDSYERNVYTVLNIDDLNLWERFTLNNFATPGYSSAGNVHFAPNSVDHYDWENKTIVQSSWIDWLDYPNLTGKIKASNSADWVPFTNNQFSAARQHHRWWFALMPHICEGRTKEGYSNNWWDYLFNGDYVTKITNNSSKTEYKINEYITLNFKLDYLTGHVEYKALDKVGIKDLNIQIGNDKIVKLENGMLKTISAGNTNIRVYYDNKYADFVINVSSI